MADIISIIKREKKIVPAIIILFGLSMIISGVSYAFYYLNLFSSTQALEQMSFLDQFFIATSSLNVLVSFINLAVGILLIVLGKKILK